MKKAPTPLTRAGIASEIAKSDFDGLVGHVAFTPAGELQKPFLFLYAVKDGKFRARSIAHSLPRRGFASPTDPLWS